MLWGVSVRSLTPGFDLSYQRNAATLLHPASNAKLLTLSAAAARLGWEFRFETLVRATATPDGEGTIHGDLVVVGSGDPTIGRQFGGGQTLAAWAEQLWQLGIRRIDGQVIGDASAFHGTSFGDGWQWDDLPFSYAAPVSALSYNENTAEFVFAPGASDGELARVTSTDAAAAGIDVSNEVRTVASASARRLSIARTPDDPRITVRGEVPLTLAPFKQYFAVQDPALYFARALRSALVARGIVVIGDARSAVTSPPSSTEGQILIRHASPPLREMAVTLMKSSQNLYAELFLRTLGATRGGEISNGADVVRDVLGAWGAGSGAVVIGDGSGLSRYNLASAAALDTVLTHMFTSSADRDPWLASLPIAGVDGTLERRMKGTAAEGRVYAKTGTIAYVRALSGYALTADDEWVQFVILANNFAGTVTTADVDRISEQAVNLLAGFSRKNR